MSDGFSYCEVNHIGDDFLLVYRKWQKRKDH